MVARLSSLCVSLPSPIPSDGCTVMCITVHPWLNLQVVSSFLAIKNKAARNIYLQVFVKTRVLIYFG